MGHTNPNFTMSVYQHVLDMTAGAQEIFESVTGASFQEAFAILSERDLQTILRPLTPETPSQPSAHTDRSNVKSPRICGAFVEAAEGTRTLDLLHGKQTL